MSDDQEQLNALLHHLDHPVPSMGAEVVIAVAQARARQAVRLRWAAAIVLGLGFAGVAYAMPGLPFKGWLQNLVSETPVQTPEPAVGGVAVAPGARLVIVFTAAQTEAWARVSLTDSADVVVHAPSGAATFTAEVDRLVITNLGAPATYEILIPRGAPRVEILVEGTLLFLKEGAFVTPRCHVNPCRLVGP